jgi:hypothetical protein
MNYEDCKPFSVNKFSKVLPPKKRRGQTPLIMQRSLISGVLKKVSAVFIYILKPA